jgi:hypothetical protein
MLGTGMYSAVTCYIQQKCKFTVFDKHNSLHLITVICKKATFQFPT